MRTLNPLPFARCSSHAASHSLPSAVCHLPFLLFLVLSLSLNAADGPPPTGPQNLRIERDTANPDRLTGTVVDPAGKPAPGIELHLVGTFLGRGNEFETDDKGRFDIPFGQQRVGPANQTPCLLARDVKRNLAAALDLEENPTAPLELRLAPGLTIVGGAEHDGKPITNATAALVFWTGNMGMHLPGLAVTNTPGRFEIPALPPGRHYGLQIAAPNHGHKYVDLRNADGDAQNRLVVEPVELIAADRKLAGMVVDADEKPVSDATVQINGDGQPNLMARTDSEGRFHFDAVCEGTVRLYAFARNSNGNMSAEGGDTNVVLKLGESYASNSGTTVHTLKGTITDPDGKPVSGAQVAVFPSPSTSTRTGTNGMFTLKWSLQPWQLQSGEPCLMVRDLAHNLAATEDFSEDTTNLNVRLKPALTITGRVTGSSGVSLRNIRIAVWLRTGNTSSDVGDAVAKVDLDGGFEVKGLPPGGRYTLLASAPGYGRKQQPIEDSDTNRIELPPFVLPPADQILAGQVVDSDEKPVSGIYVSISGEDQPEGNVTTDRNGRFSLKVCEGQVRLFASGQNGYADITAEAGDTNVTLQLSQNTGSLVRAVTRASLKGRPLPDLSALAITNVPSENALLLCLIDAEQRPSRRTARLLADQYQSLKQKGLTVLAVQATVASAETMREWTNSSPLPFAIGCVPAKSPATRWVTDVESLPWLILRDAKGTVAAEGFPLEELDAKLQQLKP